MLLSRRKFLIAGGATLISAPAIVRAQQGLVLPQRGLAFPGGQPGFDPSHPAAKGIVRFSGMPSARGGGYVNLLNGVAGVPTATPPTTVMGQAGPGMRVGFTGAVWSAFAGQPAVTDNNWTMAGIILGERNAADIIPIITSSNSGAPVAIGLNFLQPFVYRGGFGHSVVISTTLNANESYFLAASGGSTGSCQMVARSLKTGQLFTGTGAFTNTSASDGTYTIAGNAVTGGGFNAQVGHSMFSTGRLGMSQLINWAADLWSFWYPNKISRNQMVGLSAVGGGSSLPLMGVGN